MALEKDLVEVQMEIEGLVVVLTVVMVVTDKLELED